MPGIFIPSSVKRTVKQIILVIPKLNGRKDLVLILCLWYDLSQQRIIFSNLATETQE